MRTSEEKLNDSLKSQITKTLAQTLSDLKDAKESEEFLRDFFTESEIVAFSKRLAISYWLKKGRSYSNIKKNLKVSSATVASVSEMMNSEGFRLALQKIEAEEWANKWSEKIKNFVGK